MQNLQNMNMQNIQNMQNMPIQNMQTIDTSNNNMNNMNNMSNMGNMGNMNNMQNLNQVSNLPNIQGFPQQDDQDLQNNTDWSESNASDQPVSGKCNFVCGVKNCGKQFKGKKKDDAKEEFLKHFRTIHQDFLANPKYEDDKQIMKTYLKKQQKLNYYCKICKEQGEDQRFSQVNNVKDRSGLEPHVKHKHPEMFTDPQQMMLMQQNNNKWRQQWCGYSGPQKTTVGRPNNNYIPMKYGQGQQDVQEDDNQITQEDVEFYASIGIDVRKNRSIDTMEYRQYLEIIENLYRQKETIEQKQREMNQKHIKYNTKQRNIGQELSLYLDQNSQERFSNLSYLILNQKTPDLKKTDAGLYPDGCPDSMGLIVEACVKKIRQDIFNEQQNITPDDQFVYDNFSQVSQLFINFYNDLIQLQQNNIQLQQQQ